MADQLVDAGGDGQVPAGVRGTPTTAGTFTVRVDDSSGQSATRQFTIINVP